MENRSFDHMLGSLSLDEGRTDVDGLLAGMSNPHPDGGDVPIRRIVEPCTLIDPPHGWTSSHTALGSGANEGFVRAFVESRGATGHEEVMAYQTRAELPIHYAFADHYGIANRWFSSVCGPTWPNRLYFHGAQSQGMRSNDFPEGGDLYTMPTIWDQAEAAGIRWAYYYTDLPAIALFGRFQQNVFPIEDFYRHAAAGTLPAIVMVEPGMASNDDHPPHHPILGQMFAASIHNALATSSQWNRSLFVLAYDEAGGFHDHVPPGLAPDDYASEGFDQLGFRVPAFAIGPWVKPGYASNVQYDHSSGLAHLHNWLGLESLTARDAAANDLTDFLDLDRMARNEPFAPAELPVFEVDEEAILEQCQYERSRSGSGQPELWEFIKRHYPHLDRTPDLARIDRWMLHKARDLGVCVLR
jgi:phospholipase C